MMRSPASSREAPEPPAQYAHITEVKEVKIGDPHALTARWAAATRARESALHDSLFTDPFAGRLAGTEGWDFRDGQVSVVDVARTRFIDEFICSQYAYGVRQYVVLGAGMDTRAFRLRGIEEAHFFEIDKVPLFAVKEPLMAHTRLMCAGRSVVELDLTEPEADLARALTRAGLDPAQTTAWILEGLVYYLSPELVERTMAVIGALAAPGSAAVHDAVSASFIAAGGAHLEEMQLLRVPWLSGHDDYSGLWASHGFDWCDVLDLHYLFVDRDRRSLAVDPKRPKYRPHHGRRRELTFFVTAMKTRI